MKPEEVAAAVAEDAVSLDLVVGPVVWDGKHVSYHLSAAHASGRAAVIETDGVERFSLWLEGFHWPEFEWDKQYQRQTVRDLMELAAQHLFGHTSETTDIGKDGTAQPALEIQWEGDTHVITRNGSRRTAVGPDSQHPAAARYRWRTRLRTLLPYRLGLYNVLAKGQDCGSHDWYTQDAATQACYHCRITRPHE